VTAKESETPISKRADSGDPSNSDIPNSDIPNSDMPNGGMPNTDLTDVQGLSYEQARDQLISIVAQLEGGQIGLEESMALWQRGEALAKHCNTWLDGAEAKLTDVTEAKRKDQD
jgi:exodeoxyribonuclease VII small subunit